MRHSLALPILLLLLSAETCLAQHSNGYVFFAPGGISCCGHTDASLHLGVGGEAVLGWGLGLGAEIGGLGTRRYFTDSVFGVFSPNGYFHLLQRRSSRVDPFVTGGYTLFFRSGHANLFNVGGGLNVWLAGRLGARLEFRDHIWDDTSGPAVHYWGVRFGLAFR
jgi:hypothetical protein